MQYLALVIYLGVKPVGGWIACAASLYQVVSIKEVLELADGNFCHFLEGAATFPNFWEKSCLVRLASLREQGAHYHGLHLHRSLQSLHIKSIKRLA